MPLGTRIVREKETVRFMVGLYVRYKLRLKEWPDEYRQLVDYAERRLDRCRFGERKPTCKNCPIHCYMPEKRARIREVMRWVGPRMFLFAPLEAIRHLFRK